MARAVQDILVLEYNGPQGNVELETVESSTLNRSKSRTRIKTMNRGRQAIAFQSGVEEVSMTLTVVPELQNPEVDWVLAWKNDELFELVGEKGIDGKRELIQDCIVSDVNDTHNENGEARQEVSVEGLVSLDEPSS